MPEAQSRQQSVAGRGLADVQVVVESVSDSGLTLTHQLVRGWHLVVVRGDLTVHSSQTLAEMLDSIVAAGGTRVIVDLARASTVEADCMHELAATDRVLRERAGVLRLVIDGVATLHAIRIAGLTGRFEIHRYVGDIVGAVPGLDEGGRGMRRNGLPSG